MLAKDNKRSPQPDLDRYAQAGVRVFHAAYRQP
jgi:hypothetical protein